MFVDDLSLFFSFLLCVFYCERRRDPSETLLSGVQRQQYSRAAHRPPNTASFRRKRYVEECMPEWRKLTLYQLFVGIRPGKKMIAALLP